VRKPNVRDDIAEAVSLDVALGLVGDGASINSVDLLGSRLSSEHGEDTWWARRCESAELTRREGQILTTSASYVENDSVLENGRV
jgi:hypothetical protein